LKHVEENLDLTITEAAPVDLDTVLSEQ
jgi:hypothetical protein